MRSVPNTSAHDQQWTQDLYDREPNALSTRPHPTCFCVYEGDIMYFQFSQMMEELKVSDSKMRGELSGLFEMTRQLLVEIVKSENIIDKQLQQEESTRDYNQKIKSFQSLLQHEDCPVVVAGNDGYMCFLKQTKKISWFQFCFFSVLYSSFSCSANLLI